MTPEATAELVSLGIPVLAETPPAPDADGLRELWADVGATGLVQVAEHSPSMPSHAARIALVDHGLIGTPTSVQISSTHLYHAVGLIRRLLRAGRGAVDRARLGVHRPARRPARTRRLDRRDRAGATRGTSWRRWTSAHGRSALYDFTDNQWHNPLRTNRIVIRGSHGEIVDDTVTRWVDERTVPELADRAPGQRARAEPRRLRPGAPEPRRTRRSTGTGSRGRGWPTTTSRSPSLLDAMGAWVRGDGPPPYPLADGCQDHLLGLAIEEAGRTGAPVRTAREAWADA